MAGISSKNVDYLADAITDAVENAWNYYYLNKILF